MVYEIAGITERRQATLYHSRAQFADAEMRILDWRGSSIMLGQLTLSFVGDTMSLLLLLLRYRRCLDIWVQSWVNHQAGNMQDQRR